MTPAAGLCAGDLAHGVVKRQAEDLDGHFVRGTTLRLSRAPGPGRSSENCPCGFSSGPASRQTTNGRQGLSVKVSVKQYATGWNLSRFKPISLEFPQQIR